MAWSLPNLLGIMKVIQGQGAGFRSSVMTSTRQPRRGGWCLTFSHRAPSSSGSGSYNGQKKGRVGGKPPAPSPTQKVEVKLMRDEEMRPIPEIASLFRVSKKSIRLVT
jgi:hypothetical protein